MLPFQTEGQAADEGLALPMTMLAASGCGPPPGALGGEVDGEGVDHVVGEVRAQWGRVDVGARGHTVPGVEPDPGGRTRYGVGDDAGDPPDLVGDGGGGGLTSDDGMRLPVEGEASSPGQRPLRGQHEGGSRGVKRRHRRQLGVDVRARRLDGWSDAGLPPGEVGHHAGPWSSTKMRLPGGAQELPEPCTLRTTMSTVWVPASTMTSSTEVRVSKVPACATMASAETCSTLSMR